MSRLSSLNPGLSTRRANSLLSLSPLALQLFEFQAIQSTIPTPRPHVHSVLGNWHTTDTRAVRHTWGGPQPPTIGHVNSDKSLPLCKPWIPCLRICALQGWLFIHPRNVSDNICIYGALIYRTFNACVLLRTVLVISRTPHGNSLRPDPNAQLPVPACPRSRRDHGPHRKRTQAHPTWKSHS